MTIPVPPSSHLAMSNPQVSATTSMAPGKEQFLQLLVAQISHQDPMNPMDDKDLVTQLAQFTSVEQAIETNSRLAALQTAVIGQTHTALTNLIGKTVVADGDVVHWDASGVPATIGFNLGAPAVHVKISIVDGAGRLVNAMDIGASAAGNQTVAWDGRGAHGESLPAGDYRVRVDAVDEHDVKVKADSKISGVVSGLAFTASGPEILVGNAHVRAADIVQILSNP